MKKIITISIIVVLTICNLVLLIGIGKINRESRNAMNVVVPYVEKYQSLRSNMEKNIRLCSFSIKGTDIYDSTKTAVMIENIFNHNQQVVFIVRTSHRFCKSCIDYCINLFKSDKIRKDFQFVFVLGSRTNNLFKNEIENYNLQKHQVFNCDEIPSRIDYEGFPYLMVVNRDLTIEYCYFPTKGEDKTDIENINMIIDCFSKKYINYE